MLGFLFNSIMLHMNTESEHIELFVKGAIIGHLIGDALGYPYENAENVIQYQIEMIRDHHGELEGSWSMPGAFALATMASINEYGGLDLDDVIEKFNDVYIAGYLTPNQECKDLGSITTEAVKNYTNGMPTDRCGVRVETMDNDCLARILPVGLYFASNPIDELINNAHAVCRLTHANAHCEVTCAAYCMVIRNLLLQRPEKALELLDDYYRTKKMDEHLLALSKLNEYRDVKNPTGIKHVFDSFWSAWSCHARNEQDFACCVTDAVYLGNDTNTTAAIAGAVSALSNGLNDIPYKWLQLLRINNEIMEITQTFVNSVIKRSLQTAE